MCCHRLPASELKQGHCTQYAVSKNMEASDRLRPVEPCKPTTKLTALCTQTGLNLALICMHCTEYAVSKHMEACDQLRPGKPRKLLMLCSLKCKLAAEIMLSCYVCI